MTILNRYIFREVFRFFTFILIMVIGIYMVVDFLERVDDFLEAGLSIQDALVYLILKIPLIISQILPVGLLLSVLVVFGLMNRHHEIIALRAGGISLARLLIPTIGMGFFGAIVLFLVAEAVVPITQARVNEIWLQQVRKERVVTDQEENIWIRGPRAIAHITFFDARSQQAAGITCSFFNAQFRLIQRIDARQGRYEDGRWRLDNVMEQRFFPDTGATRVHFFDTLSLPLDFTPDDLTRAAVKSEEMNLIDLLAYIRKIEAEGYSAALYRVDFHAKIAFPLVCLIMTLTAVAISLGTGRKDSLPISIAFGILAAFIYWIFYSFCLSLGYGEILPPWLAAWSANAIFMAIATFMLLNVSQ